MAKYGQAASKRVKSALHRTKKGTLKSSSGRKVTSRKQAIAIGLSEAREKGGKVPSRATGRKTAKGGKKKAAKGGKKKSSTSSSRKTSSRKTSGAKKR